MNSSMNIDQIKPYLLPIISFGALIILGLLLIKPWIGDVQKAWDETQKKQDQLAAMKTKADQLEAMDGESNLALLTENVEPAIPNTADPAGLLGTIEQAALAAGGITKGVHYGGDAAVAAPVATADGAAAGEGAVTAKTITANLSVEGSYANILSFISRTEKIVRVMSINTVHIVPSNDGESGGTLTAIFGVSSPYEPTPDDLGPSEAPLPERTSAKTQILDTISKLQRANYAPTPAESITGKNNPF